MDDDDFNGIVAGLEDAIAFSAGDASRGKAVAGPNVRAIRARTKLTQLQFAAAFGLPLGTVRD